MHFGAYRYESGSIPARAELLSTLSRLLIRSLGSEIDKACGIFKKSFFFRGVALFFSDLVDNNIPVLQYVVVGDSLYLYLLLYSCML